MKKIFICLAFGTLGYQSHAQTPNFTAQKNGIKISGFENPKTFLDAKLDLVAYNPDLVKVLDTGKTSFEFKVENYTLGAQTPDADMLMCANSAKGQHIHFILDNQPYQASYSTDITANLKPGHHVLLAFLSRSYHESLKSKSAYTVKEFDVAKKGVDQFDANAPHIFYSRPKAEYVGKKETQKILLDFYLINCQLSDKGYKVKATINGADFILTNWEPYFIEGLPMGETKIKLELLDKDNKVVASPYNGTERTIKLLEEPAAK